MVKNKCLGCTTRSVGCHQCCESYQLFNKECARIRDVRKKNSIYDGYMRSCTDKADKRNRQHGLI